MKASIKTQTLVESADAGLRCFEGDLKAIISIEQNASELPASPTFSHRVLILSGRWQKPGSEFRLEATIYVQNDGQAEGIIHWQNMNPRGIPATLSGTESVRGGMHGSSVDLKGYQTEPGLAVD